uniref:DDE Tnp4 domain-containing protein n=1 Tax=Coturnix japonica TaxID=93934 RepID=A0A8C2Y5U8_COTJA
MAAPSVLPVLLGSSLLFSALLAVSSLRLRRLRSLGSTRRFRSVLRRLRRRRSVLLLLGSRFCLRSSLPVPPSPRLWSKRRSCEFWDTLRRKDFTRREWDDNFRVAPETFDFLFSRLRSAIERRDTSMRRAVPPDVRLALTLWRLGAGSEYRAVELRFGVSRSTVCKILRDVCEAVVADLGPWFNTPPGCVPQGAAILPPPPPFISATGAAMLEPDVAMRAAIGAPEVRQGAAIATPEVTMRSAITPPEVRRRAAINAPEVRLQSAITPPEVRMGPAINTPEVAMGAAIAAPEAQPCSAIAPPPVPVFRPFPLPQLCGVLTRVRVPIRAPPDSASRYSAGSGWHAVTLQAVVDPVGLLWAVEVSPPGGGVRGSELYRELQRDNGRLGGAERDINGVRVRPFVLGRERDPLLPWLMRPYRERERGDEGSDVRGMGTRMGGEKQRGGGSDVSAAGNLRYDRRKQKVPRDQRPEVTCPGSDVRKRDRTQRDSGGLPEVSIVGTGSAACSTGTKRSGSPDVTSCATKRLRFNMAAAAARGSAMAAVRRLRSRWRCLQKRNDGDVSFLPTLIAACCLLHNVCTQRGDPVPPGSGNGAGMDSDGEEEEELPDQPEAEAWRLREAVADAMMG